MKQKKCQHDDESDVIEMGEDGSYDLTQQPAKAKKDTLQQQLPTRAMPNEEQEVKKDKEEDSGLQRKYE